MPLRLYVLRVSHYCERARWALQHAGADFEEVAWPVGPHVFLARRLGCKSTSTPILETPDGVIQGSDRILDYCGLAGADPALEARFETRIGPLVRRYIYSGLLFERGAAMPAVLRNGLGVASQLAGLAMWPMTRRAMISGMECRPELLESLAAKLDGELDWFEERLRGRPYLSNEGFGRADITAASLLAPLARPQQLEIYRSVALPKAMERKAADWERRPAMVWVNQMYERRRSRKATGQGVEN